MTPSTSVPPPGSCACRGACPLSPLHSFTFTPSLPNCSCAKIGPGRLWPKWAAVAAGRRGGGGGGRGGHVPFWQTQTEERRGREWRTGSAFCAAAPAAAAVARPPPHSLARALACLLCAKIVSGPQSYRQFIAHLVWIFVQSYVPSTAGFKLPDGIST